MRGDAMRAIDFRGFRFGKVHSSDLNLEVVSTSNKYENRVLPAPTDTAVDVPGGDGQYYFGSVYKNREITVNVAFDKVSEQIYRKIRQLFATDKLQDLVFDEEPYKTWRAKLKSKPDFKSLCFTDENGERVYKGDGKLVFICYYPYAFGFEKYVVRAADYYMLNPPECIINKAYSDDTFVKENKDNGFKPLPEDTKYHYNVNPSDYEGGTTEENIFNQFFRDESHQNEKGRSWTPNDKVAWKSGFPTPEQVQAGELYFDTDQGEKTIIDVRGYWKNIPEWQGTAKLLTTPTLDFDQELMYLPQYSKTDFINMEIGFMNNRPMIGSRMLVYNPGDLPVDWEIKFDENKRSFWSCRGGTKFRIRRFNVERLKIENAVDWCGLTTYDIADNEPYKYGNRYFKRRSLNKQQIIDNVKEGYVDETFYKSEEDGGNSEYYTAEEVIEKLKKDIMITDKHWDITRYPYCTDYTYGQLKETRPGTEERGYYNNITSMSGNKVSFNLHLDDFWANYIDNDSLYNLGDAHPHYCYYVEPIPREKLGHYIKLFYWQTIHWRGNKLPDGTWTGTSNWIDSMPEGMVTLTEDGIAVFKEINNPLLQFLSTFLRFYYENDVLYATNNNVADYYRELYAGLDFERGIEFANRYEELFAECLDEEEEYELYWDTLKKLLMEFQPILDNANEGSESKTSIEEFIDSYINHPSEFIGTDLRDLDYSDDVFNGYKMPTWMTPDYMEIDQSLLSGVATIKEYLAATGEDPDGIFSGKRVQFTKENYDKLKETGQYSKLLHTLETTIGIGGYLNDLLDDYYFLNTDNRMLYTTENPYGMEFTYKPNKKVMNDAIIKGKWFKLPPGWSLICIEPIIDETIWGGKRWEDGRPFDWGYGGDMNRNKREVQQLYDYVYERAKEEFFKVKPENDIRGTIVSDDNIAAELPATFDDWADHPELQDELLKFKVWYEKEIKFFTPMPFAEHINVYQNNYFAYGLYNKLKNDGEYEFLKIINSIWGMIAPYFKWTSLKGVWTDPDTGEDPTLDDYDITGLPMRCINADISDWWWYACNYLWANFPPLYWAVADMLNRIQIKYTPLYY